MCFPLDAVFEVVDAEEEVMENVGNISACARLCFGELKRYLHFYLSFDSGTATCEGQYSCAVHYYFMCRV